jgi:hypothetical protein
MKKARFASREEAVATARLSGLSLFAYRCDRCRLFHLTSRAKGKAWAGAEESGRTAG